MNQPKIEPVLDQDTWTFDVKVTCAECKVVHTRSIASLKADAHIKCSCGAGIDVSTRGLDSAQRSLDEFRKNLSKSGFSIDFKF